ncbi:Thioredoxin [Nitrosospira briensis]|uniref:Thioredoxin n=1 Tax=Nitrosospira briensis TaxID=35799 RepID=A0A1I4Y5N4_9PROT|nr:DUF4157 domain-containing protein [Nitrosospira briensis]SFN33337.1 Thioredoxin [Nitrosospira briensis]
MNQITSQTQNRGKTDPLAASGILQRKCACGSHIVAGGKCTDCTEREHSLQRKAANTGKLGLPIQRKLTIGACNDPLEQEADRIADQVMLMPANAAVNRAPLRIQRFTGSPTRAIPEVPPSVERVLSSSGTFLEPKLRQDMERRFGYDFSHVRVYSGGNAEQSAREVSANAYTVGSNIVFGAGQFSPKTNTGRRLLGHELVHVIQQNGFSKVQRQTAEDIPDLEDFGSSPFGRPLNTRSAEEIYSRNRQLVPPLTDVNFDATLGAACAQGRVLVVDFWDRYCRPCDRVALHMTSLARRYQSGPFRNRVGFFQVEWDRRVNPSLYQRFPLRSLPTVYFYWCAGSNPTLEDQASEALPEAGYSSRVEVILRRHGIGGEAATGSRQEQGSSSAVSSSEGTQYTPSLLIHHRIVRTWMREAYRRSDMGATEERRTEWGGKIKRSSTGILECAFHTDGHPSEIATCPRELGITPDGHIGNSLIVGSFHTHPNSRRELEPPSPADRNAMVRRRECMGMEEYVIGVHNIYVVFPDGTGQSLGRTNDWLFEGAPLIDAP